MKVVSERQSKTLRQRLRPPPISICIWPPPDGIDGIDGADGMLRGAAMLGILGMLGALGAGIERDTDGMLGMLGALG